MPIPHPTPIYRFIHVENLPLCLERGGIYAPNFEPENGLTYKTIHSLEIQQHRHVMPIPCGPCGIIHDYVPFYFGYLSPMLLQLHTNRVAGYTEGQGPIIYLETTAQTGEQSGAGFVFSDAALPVTPNGLTTLITSTKWTGIWYINGTGKIPWMTWTGSEENRRSSWFIGSATGP